MMSCGRTRSSGQRQREQLYVATQPTTLLSMRGQTTHLMQRGSLLGAGAEAERTHDQQRQQVGCKRQRRPHGRLQASHSEEA
jgi:hypothetical protein